MGLRVFVLAGEVHEVQSAQLYGRCIDGTDAHRVVTVFEHDAGIRPDIVELASFQNIFGRVDHGAEPADTIGRILHLERQGYPSAFGFFGGRVIDYVEFDVDVGFIFIERDADTCGMLLFVTLRN